MAAHDTLPLVSFEGNDDTNAKASKKEVSAVAASLNVFSLILGSSAVVAPYTFRVTTPYWGVLFEAVAAVILWVSAVCLFNVSKIVKCTSFLNLGEKAFGTTLKGKVLNVVFILLPLVMIALSATASYINIAADIAVSYISIRPTFAKLIVCGVMFILGLFRNFKNLDVVSYFTFGLYVLVIGFITYESLSIMPLIGYSAPRFGPAAITSIPLFFVLLHGHIVIPGVTGEMSEKAKEISSVVAAIALSLAAVTGVVAGFFPAIIFGVATKDDILKQLFAENHRMLNRVPPLIVLAQIFLAVSIILKIPVVFIPLKEILLDRKDRPMRECSLLQNIAATFGIVFLSGFIAIVLPTLKSILEVTGGFGALAVTGITAAVLTLMIEKGSEAKIRGIFVLFVGVICTVGYIYTVIANIIGTG